MTDIYCTKCGKEFEEYENVVAIIGGMVANLVHWPNEFMVALNDGPHIETLCKECYEESIRPNRVVVEVRDNVVSAVRAERPDELLVIIRDYDLGRYFNREEKVRPLNTVALTDEEIEARWEEQKAWSEEKKDLYNTGMGR